MNKANVNGKTIEDGDYLIIDSDYRSPRNGDVVLSVIDDMANIKIHLGRGQQSSSSCFSIYKRYTSYFYT